MNKTQYQKIKDSAIEILTTLQKYNYKAYFAGGCVRDMLMNIDFSHDYDIATNAFPNEILKIFPRALRVGEQFGVIIVVKDGIHYEIATFRKDGPYLDGRRPSSIEFADETEDVKRRDFTINGMLYEPNSKLLFDIVHGKKDIDNKIIRTIGNPFERFNEDKLRLIRAIRFSVQLDFTIEQNTYSAIKKLASKMKTISRERIQVEFYKIIESIKIRKGLELLIETRLFDTILENFNDISYNVFDEVLDIPNIIKNIDIISNESFNCKLSYLLLFAYNKNKNNIVKKYLKELKSSNTLVCVIDEIQSILMEIIEYKDMPPIWKIKRWIRNQNFEDIIKICSIYKNKTKHFNELYSILEDYLEKYQNLKDELEPKIFLDGNDLIKLGFKPGEVFRDILFDLENKQLENIINSKDEAIDYIKQKYIHFQ